MEENTVSFKDFFVLRRSEHLQIDVYPFEETLQLIWHVNRL